jgi:hypothetical protein
MSEKPTPFANTPEFFTALGLFYAAWSRAELAIDCAIWKALETETAEQAHERSAGMKFSAKCKQLRTLLDAGPTGHKARELLGQIENYGRNVFAHSFLASDARPVTFIHRKMEAKKYQATGYTITREDFIVHVQDFVQLSFNFEQAIGLLPNEVADFAVMAIPLATQET